MTEPDYFYRSRAMHLAAREVGASVDQLTGPWRSPHELVTARWAVMIALRRRGMGVYRIAHAVRRDRKTVRYGLQQGEALARRDPDFAALVARVEAA